jgi:hypothetical protein
MKRGQLAAVILFLQIFLLLLAFGQTPTPRQGKTMDQLIDEALAPQNKEEKKTPLSKEEQTGLSDAIKRDAAAAFSSAIPAEDWCQRLLKAPIDKNLPKS